MQDDRSERRPPPNYLAHTEYGRLFNALGRQDEVDLSSLSDASFSRLRRLALELMTAARGTADKEKIDTAMSQYVLYDREYNRRSMANEN